MDKTSLPTGRSNQAAGFSLVEVALAIGIIAFAFVALFSLIPTGLTKFRESIDTASETWIMDGLNSIVQTTEWEKIYSKGNSELSQDTYYYDEEARLTDTKERPSTDPIVQERRLYAARMFVFPLDRPGTASDTSAKNFTRDGTAPVAVKVIAVMARIADRETAKQLDDLSIDTVTNLPATSRLRLKSFVATQMNSARN